ncbi:hypothetical protein BS78_10G232500 [Paspalum vaginatum]|nr:hypothetical protein BS78_10G232500 [Paspalum vaginatum]
MCNTCLTSIGCYPGPHRQHPQKKGGRRGRRLTCRHLLQAICRLLGAGHRWCCCF